MVLDESLTEEKLTQDLAAYLGLVPRVKDYVPISQNRMPDFNYIRKELTKNGMTKKLLWSEYLAKCDMDHVGAFRYSQFFWLIQQDEQEHHATMHIKRKPGEQFESIGQHKEEFSELIAMGILVHFR